MTKTVMPPTYEELVQQRIVLLDDIVQAKARHREELRVLQAKLTPLERAIAVAEDPNGVTAMQFQIARAILIVEWGHDQRGRRRQDSEITRVIEDAVEELRKGGGRLRRCYFGIKQYDAWAAQREDHDYGFGPKHGSIWFRIGMTGHFRSRPEWLAEYERVACIAWLNSILKQPHLLDIAEGVK